MVNRAAVEEVGVVGAPVMVVAGAPALMTQVAVRASLVGKYVPYWERPRMETVTGPAGSPERARRVATGASALQAPLFT